jgi:MFS family permease
LWLGLAAGSPLINKWSDAIKARKSPVIISCVIQLAALLAIIYLPMTGILSMGLCFIVGFSNAGHMLAFTIAGDNVPPRLIGTSASIVNGAMFIVGGVLMNLPGRFLEGTAGDLPAFQHAMLSMPVLLAVSCAVSLIVKESHPAHQR